MAAKKEIKLSRIMELFENGYTRYKKDHKADSVFKGSVQEEYGLTFAEATKLFANKHLKDIRIKKPKEDSFMLIEDLDEPIKEDVPLIMGSAGVLEATTGLLDAFTTPPVHTPDAVVPVAAPGLVPSAPVTLEAFPAISEDEVDAIDALFSTTPTFSNLPFSQTPRVEAPEVVLFD